MAAAYSMGLRRRVVDVVEREGLSCNQAAARFDVAVSTAIDWGNRYRRTGSVAPGQMGGHRPKKLIGEYRDWLLECCRDREFTLRGLVGELATRGLSVDYRVVWSFVHEEKLSCKKKTLIASERDRPDVARRRQQWMAYQDRIDPALLVFIDETWTKTNPVLVNKHLRHRFGAEPRSASAGRRRCPMVVGRP